MSSGERNVEVVVGSVPGGRLQRRDPESGRLLIPVDDRSVTRGFGAFEVIHGIDGGLLATDAHLERMRRSCARLVLPCPPREAWLMGMRDAMRRADLAGEFQLRLVLAGGTGREDTSAWVGFERVPVAAIEARRRPRTAVALDRGVGFDAGHERPWLLHGVKSLSYAGNLIAERTARDRGAEEAIYASNEGALLEAPTASVVARRGRALVATDLRAPVLPGTTQRMLFDIAGEFGLDAAYGRIPLDGIADLDGLWLLSASRLATAISSVDGVPVAADMALTRGFNEALMALAEPLN